MKASFDEFVSGAERAVEKALGLGFDDAGFVIGYERSFMAKFANSLVTVVQSWVSVKVGVYLARNGRTYFSETDVQRPDQLLRIVEDVHSTIDAFEKAELYAPLPEPTGRPLEGLCDKHVIEKLEDVAEYAWAIIDETQASAGNGVRVAGMVEFTHGYRGVVTSKGARLVEEHSGVEAYARAIAGEFSGHWAWTGIRLNEKELRGVGRRAGEYARLASRGRVSIEPGKYRAILSPLVIGNLFGDIGFMASGLAVIMGFSVFSKHGIGSRIGSEYITIIDDPHDKDLPGSTGFDDEGVATRAKPIIEKGVVKNLLHNSKTAAVAKTESTGNAGLVMPRPWNIIVPPGDLGEEEAIQDTRRGLLVTNNWYTRFQNYVEGVFSTVTRDALLYIEEGEVKGSVTRLRIADTIPRLLQNAVGATRKLFQISWWETPYPTKSPFIVVEDLNFTKPEV